MATPAPDATSLSPEERNRQLRRAVVASAVGTAIEWYDFFLYGVAAALVFPSKFFPAADPYVGALLSFSTYFVGFLARPLGAAIFGHVGDRVGRKASLVATLLLMGVATAGIGLVPAYDSIGIWGAVLLTFARVLQGIGVGGEWGGSVLLAAEWSDRRRRGLMASWPQWGAPAGLVLANGAVSAASALSGDAFTTWGWRVPFLASVVLVIVGFWIRTGILETPAFAKRRAEGQVEKAPVVEVVRRHGKEIALTALLRTGQQAPFYIFSTWLLTYGTKTLGLPREMFLNAVMIAATVSLITIPIWGHLSDRVGRRRLVLLGCALMVVFPFAYFQLIDSRAVGLIVLAAVLGQAIHDIQYGPQAALIAESFPGRLRYSGASLGYQLASITAGGPAPMIAVWLEHRYGSSTAIAAYLSLAALVSLASVWFLPDRSHAELEE
ncbi:MAG: MFS transporter [Deltaproteobacteria bacterium RBG_16_71_12]|nr:MAG: MFS transporter [Deltaproteobacteria bacterium RBG_16_71_12]